MTTRREDQDVEPAGKYQRTITLTQDMADRLHAVCEHLGVTASAYLKQAIGEAVARHEVSLLAKQSKDNSMEVLTRFFEAMAQEATTDDKPKRPRAAKAK